MATTPLCPDCQHAQADHSRLAGCLQASDGKDCTCSAKVFAVAQTPYAGTSGWSGSEASRERAEHDDSTGVTANRQAATLAFLDDKGPHGATWRELAAAHRWHHGQASGVLSVLHKAGSVVRLANERRNRCSVYVLPHYAGARDTAPHGGQRKAAALVLTAEERDAVDRLRAEWEGVQPVPVMSVLTDDVAAVLVLLDRLA